MGVNLGFNKSSSKSSSHNESAVVTTIQGKDENSRITYKHVKNIDYIGTQAQNTKLIYNDVENISKSAVAFNNSYSSSSKSSGVSTGVTINYNNGFQAEANAVSISASKSKMNSNGTTYQNGRFVNVDEVHNNTKNMMLSGFHQEGGTVTGKIQNLMLESKQNTSTTTGSTKGGSLSISPTGVPSGSVKDSQTKGERKVVDTPTTFLIGDGSHVKVGKVENTAGAIGATGTGKLSIDEYVGHNLENVEKLKTKGGSIGISTTGISSIGLEYSDRKQEGVTKNTVIGNVEIGKSSGDEIHKDLASMTEITKDRKFETNIHVEAQTINYVKNSEQWKEDITKAKNEIHDIYHTVDSTVNPKGKESRNVFEQLGEVRQARTIHNVIASRLEVAEKKEDIAKAFEGVSKDLGYKVKVIYTDPRNSPQLIGTDKDGNSYIKDGTAYVDERTGIHHILINSKSEGNKTKAGLIGTIAEEQSHIIGKIEGRQKKVPDGSEKGLENLGRPTNAFFQEQYRKNNQAIEVVSDGKDYSNVDFGEHVGDHPGALVFSNPYTAMTAGIAIAGYALLPEEQKEAINDAVITTYEEIKERIKEIGNHTKISYAVVKSMLEQELQEKGITASVTVDTNKENGNIMYTVSPILEDMNTNTFYYKEHTKNKRKSNENKHQNGDARRNRDQGGEKKKQKDNWEKRGGKR
ncbi:hypothetical protein IX329_002441 [Fusobacterium necrophorum]|nr:hypothetical protein [Fusobacterium necrophorum]